ncbi:hypothetical protein THAOC_05751 [Thalassiosira oceanica]|uniref:Uncharacterized protein n=1 Tax=Thalassiosira oceanica TaxID=159749 RepID=K0T287_THAOC|nr:hypothetical protein THAOC_05751 [Thalassiosira oceanica]|eukprot:EJK72693.1 hypothetical protein THAOC_05751 [Thalassiosira oceanica]
MASSINTVAEQEVATVKSALFNPDVVFLLAGLLDARDLSHVSQSCKTLGGRANAVDGLSLVEEAARRLFECASEWERSCLRKYPDEGWIELYRHLLMLRSKLTFDQLVGINVQHGEEGSIIRSVPGHRNGSSALCSHHVMRSGKHFAVFTGLEGFFNIGVVRPVQIISSDFFQGVPIFFREEVLEIFSPGLQRFWEYLLGQRTARWTDSNVHCCSVSKAVVAGKFFWYDWRRSKQEVSIDGLQSNTPIGLLLDLVEGTLSIYQNGQRLATLKNRLSGEYCWFATVSGVSQSIAIERGLAPEDQRKG